MRIHSVKRILCIVLTLAILAGLAAPAVSAAEELKPGEFVCSELVAPQYENASTFSDGLAAVEKNGKWGYIDETGRTVVPFRYDAAFPFNEGVAVAGKYETRTVNGITAERLHGYIVDMTGRETALYYRYGGTYGYGDETMQNGTVPVELSVIDGGYCYMGSILLKGGDTGGVLFDRAGNQRPLSDKMMSAWYTPTENSVAADFQPSLYGYGYCMLDADGAVASKLMVDTILKDYIREGSVDAYGELRPFNQGLAPLGFSLFDWSSGTETDYRYGFINKSGKFVIKPVYSDFIVSSMETSYEVFGDGGYASVRNANGKWGMIDKTGKTVIPFSYDWLWKFSEGLASFEKDGKWGYIDMDNNIVIPAKFASATSFNRGMAAVYDGANAYIIDRYGNKVEGSDALSPDNYFQTAENGAPLIHTVGEIVTIVRDGKYGFARVDYEPALPKESELHSWGCGEVRAAIEAELVPAALQNSWFENITRGEFAELVVQALETVYGKDIDVIVKEKTGKDFFDIVASYPFTDTNNYSVLAAYALGIVKGIGDGTFAPYNTITRQEAAVMLMNAGKLLGLSAGAGAATSFADNTAIAGWARGPVSFVSELGVMNGTGGNTFSPKISYTREQSFLTIYRLFLAMKKA